MRYGLVVTCAMSATAVFASGSVSAGVKAGIQCGLGGMGGGYLACKLTRKTDEQCVKIAAAAAVLSAVTCSVYAKHLEKRRKELAGRENDLDAQIRYAKGLNEDTQKLNTDLLKLVSHITEETDRVVAQIAQQLITHEQLQAERKTRDELLAASQQQVNQGTEALNYAKELREKQTSQSTDLDAAILQQEKLLADAATQVRLLAAQRARV